MSTYFSDPDFIELIRVLKQKIRAAQVKAKSASNVIAMKLYWDVGNEILHRQSKAKWGDGVIGQISKELTAEFGGTLGCSTRNLKYMRRFAKEYPNLLIGQQAVAQIGWGQNIILLQKCHNTDERIWYAAKAIENGWSKNALVIQIENELYKRQGAAVTNFSTTLPDVQSDMANEMLKDPYLFDFLNITEQAQEKELEDALIEKVTAFLLELGTGFAYVGRQVPVTVSDKDYFIDLLFYHLKLRCFIVIDLKTGEFKPEYAGKMGFYLSAIDNQMTHTNDHPSIGLILCKTKDRIIAEYSLMNINRPIGVSDFSLGKAKELPEELQDDLPSVELLESKLKDVIDD